MKIADGMEIIRNGWVRKAAGFRVRFHRLTDSGFERIYSPPLAETALNSDVTAWRYAWKLWQAAGNEFFNITVVDETDQPTPFYATGEVEIYNPKAITTPAGRTALGDATD